MPAKYQYSEDMFADTRMSFGEHIEDLRTHLIRAIYWFVLGMVLGFVVGHWVLHYIETPAVQALEEFYARRKVEMIQKIKDGTAPPDVMAANADKLVTMRLAPGQWDAVNRRLYPELFANVPPPPADAATLEIPVRLKDPVLLLADLQPAQIQLGPRPGVLSMGPTEALMVWFTVCLICGFVVASPMIFIEIWSFVAAGLYPHEKKYVHRYLPASIGLFIGGVMMCEIWVMPAALRGLLWFNEWLGVEPQFRLSEWISFAIWLPVVFGLCFQTPLVMMFLGKIGVFSAQDFASKRRWAYMILLVVALIIAPPADIWTYLLLWVPMCLLYEAGIWLVKYTTRASLLEDIEVPYTPEEPRREEEPTPRP